MKKIVLSIVASLVTLISFAQNNINGYEYWFDNDFAGKTTTSVTPSQQLNVNQLISTSGLTSGVHTFNFRSFDDNGLYSSVASSFFYKTSAINTNPNPTVVAYEYWLDNDYANAVTVSTPAQQQVNINNLISMSAIPNGVHTFNIRFKDNLNVWSSVASSFFYKTSAISTNPNPTVVAYEYWLDNDYANAVTVSTPAQQQVNINNLISMSAVTNGVHTFNIRFKDNLNVWSSVASSFFYKTSAISTNPNPTVVAYEYWLDNDYANAVTVSTPAQQQVNINNLISMSAIPNGVHTFNIRFKDNLNVWSSVASSFFYKTSQQTVVQNQVVGYRYWFDNDFVNAVYTPLTANVQVNVMDNLDMTHIPKGMHQVHFQFKDTLQQWSVVVSDSIEKISLPIANFAYSPTPNCDSTIITFVNNSIDGDTYLWDFGDGTTDTTATPTHNYYTPGSYLVSLTVTDTLTLADSTYQTSLFVTGNTTHTFAITACDSYTSPSGNYIFTTSGTHHDTIPNQWGCDSLLTIIATINQATTSTDVQTACFSYTWIDGNTYTSSNNTAIYTLQNVNGCDSVVTLNLTINTVNTDVTQNEISLTSNASGATYQWLDCDNAYTPISGETNAVFTATVNGNYAVEVTQNGCTNTSACYAVTTVGIIKNSLDNSISVYPNPTKGAFTIKMGESLDDFTITIMDVTGKVISRKSYEKMNTVEMNLDVQPGLYLIAIQSGNQQALVRLVKE